MTPEHLTNEELAELVRDFREKMLNSGGRAWSLTIPAKETDPDIMLTEIERRLRNSIPKPDMTIEQGDIMYINGTYIGIVDEQCITNVRKALGFEGGGDE